MTDFQYNRAPITEAVVEIRCATSANEKKRQKALKRLRKHYNNHEPVPQQNIDLELQHKDGPKLHATEYIRDKLSSDDMTRQLHITDVSFLVSQLAPYTGWENLKQRIMRDWEIWRKVVGFQKIKRVGMRYINRIDVPISDTLVHYEDFVTVYPKIPPLLDPIAHYSTNIRVELKELQAHLNLKSALVDSPIPNHIAIVIDLDIVRQYQTPPSDEELYSFISEARIKKNEIFEASITDKARELFS